MADYAILCIMLRIKDKPAFPPNSIKPLRTAKGLTMDGLATAVGTDASTINKLEKSQMRLTDKWLSPLAKALDATADEILKDPDASPTTKPFAEVRKADVEIPAIAHLPNDVPVRGTAAGSHLRGAFQMELTVVDWVRRPPALLGAKNLYALYVEGTSMVPEHNPGDLRFVHPDRPPRIGDSVIVEVEINGETESLIGHLLKRNERAWFIGKLNPEATVELKRETVKAVHKVLTVNEMFGV